LSAIGKLSGSPGTPTAIAEVATISSVPLSKDAAKRRQLSHRLDRDVGVARPEDMRGSGIIEAFVP
jgi:hypothetical protein